jgi:hypothetical protein
MQYATEHYLTILGNVYKLFCSYIHILLVFVQKQIFIKTKVIMINLLKKEILVNTSKFSSAHYFFSSDISISYSYLNIQ